ncbi:hypothetical protein [Flagellimonas marina]|uniref:Uncharacterized protein n=1 Tax=Flagellimonas marina TaxID=1775168 RepID=A0ABV8PHK9_9FLAO
MGLLKFFNIKGIINALGSNIREILLVASVIILVLQFIRTNRLIEDNARKDSNILTLTAEKAEILQEYTASTREWRGIMDHVLPGFGQKLDSANIKIKNIERIYSQRTTYLDTTKRTTGLDTILGVIQMGVKTTGPIPVVEAPIVDKGPCHIIRGHVGYDGKKLWLDITERKFTTINEVVTHIIRRQWKILGLIPTRLFGKRELAVTVFNSCGETETVIMHKYKGKWKRKK